MFYAGFVMFREPRGACLNVLLGISGTSGFPGLPGAQKQQLLCSTKVLYCSASAEERILMFD